MKNVTVKFSPKGGIAAQIVASISSATAKSTILMASYSFTNTDISNALVKAVAAGVPVMVIMERTLVTGTQAKIHDQLVSGGVQVRLYSPSSGIQHSKFIVILPSFLETGSFNFTVKAEKSNCENVLFIKDPTLTDAYHAQFSYLWSKSKPERTTLRGLVRTWRSLRGAGTAD